MPINIYEQKSTKKIAWLCDELWDLPWQLSELENWLKSIAVSKPKSEFVIDIGFDIRPNATGGAAVFTSEMLEIMSNKGFEIFLSEYPNQLSNQE